MISANNVTLRIGKKALFEDVNIKFTEGNCYGLIGANGAGKSTFLKILTGQIEPSKGDVSITPGQRLSFLEQDHFKYDEYTVLDTVIMGNTRLYEIMKEKEAIYAKPDFSEEDGMQTHFYNSLQFYYETEYGSDRLTKFVSFENVSESKTTSERLYLVNRYEERENAIYMSSILYNGSGKPVEELIAETKTKLEYIPAVVIFNDGTLQDKRGVSEMESLAYYEEGYSRLSNGDIDSERKGMNPIRYTVDMSPNTTKNLPSGAGAYWDLQTNQNIDNKSPMVGTLAPQMNHTEAVKETLTRIKTAMYNEVDVPNISEETMAGTITSGKALKALYYPLQVRCDEKMKAWRPALEFIVETILDLAKLNKDTVSTLYVIPTLAEIQYNIQVVENYALMEDEETEKDSDLAEIAANARSRKSYIKKWRKEEFKTDEQIEKELMQISVELNMFDSMSMNTQVQGELDKQTTESEVQNNIDDIETQTKLGEQNGTEI